MSADGWIKSGDAGYRDELGYFYLCDRLKDVVVSGGENIYPAEVENVLSSYPPVQEVAVVGIPCDKFGEALLAVIVPRAGEQANLSDMIEFCRDKLAGFKIPRQLEVRSELPKNASGKIDKRSITRR